MAAPYTEAQLAEMAKTPPAGFISLANISSTMTGQFRNVMGTVSDCMPPRKTSKNEWQSTLRLTDASLGGQGLQVVFFNEAMTNVPTPQMRDVMVISGVKVNSFRGDIQLLSSKSHTDWISIPQGTIVQPSQRSKYNIDNGPCLPHRKSSAADMPTVHQQQWAITLTSPASATGSNTQTSPNTHHETSLPNPTSLPSLRAVSRKAGLIRDVQDQKFYDLTGQVIKIFSAGSSIHGDIVDVHLTDFTTRSSGLHDYQPPSAYDSYGDNTVWRGPYGKQTLKVECHEPHGSWIMKHAVAGQILTLQNVRVKWNRDGQFIEGNIFPDQRYPKKICAFEPLSDDPVVLELLRRRKGYQTTAQKRGWDNLLKIVGDKGSNSESKSVNSGLHLTGEPKKKKQKRAVKPLTSNDNSVPASATPSYRDTLKRQRDPHLNPSVTVSMVASGTGLCKMTDIINNPTRLLKMGGETHELPFVNCKYLLQMRVVDFYPHDIRDFCIRRPIRTKYGLDTRWLWAFYLLVEAAHESEDACKAPLLLEVSNVEAKRFLCLEPTDMRSIRGKDIYSSLIRKLRLLWGDLDEVKKDYFDIKGVAPTDYHDRVYGQCPPINGNRPFEGCIEEFGQPADVTSDDDNEDHSDYVINWRRHYKLCDTIMT